MQSDGALTDRVAAVRSSIALAMQRSAVCRLGEVLSDPECAAAWVVKVLDVHPCSGKVAGRRLLAGLGVAERTRLGDLSAGEVRALTGSCRCNGG